MQGASRDALKTARENLDVLIRVPGADLDVLADELFAVVAILDREGALRRALTDPGRGAGDRTTLVRSVLAGRVSENAGDVLASVVSSRWSGARDLVHVLELLAVEAVIASAEREGRLDAVEDELFRTSRIIAGSPELRVSLSDRSAPVEHRIALIDGLLAGKVSDQTARLARQAVAAPRGRSLDRTLETYATVAAERRSRVVATVTAAVPLTEEQRERLSRALASIYGREIQLNIDVNPGLVGGIRVEIGDEVIDGSVISRLGEARRRLAS
jgi:F-type H+-transporting ATPase subunit delta